MDPSASATLTIGNPNDNEAFGKPVEVEVTISGLATTLKSYGFDVDFTPSVLSAVATSSGTGTIDNIGGSISGVARDNVGLNFGGALLKLYFNAIGPGTCFLSIPTSSVSLLDSNGNEIPFATTDGKVSVT
ncbi:MAG: cohesin domain-containing protein [Acidobacteriota bacterium]